MKKGDILELDIEGYAFEGKGIAKINKPTGNDSGEVKKFVVFVHGSYPGDKVTAKIIKVKKSYAEARVEEILIPASERIKARCKYFGICGGCKAQDLDYPRQVFYKHEQVKDILERIGGLSGFEFESIIASDKTFFYRNKMEFSFAEKRWLRPDEISNTDQIIDKDFALGLHIPGLFDKVLDIDECFLQSETSNKILNFTRDFFKSRNTSIYTIKTHSGYLRNLVIKQSHHTDDLMVNLVTGEDNEQLFSEYTSALVKEIPAITTVINNVNLKKALIAFGDYEKVYHGSGFIYDYIGKYKFRISANSFFQTNTLQAEKLYSTVVEYAGFSGNETVYDLYSGAGTIAIFISALAKKIYAFENVDSANEDANTNLTLNNITNINFIQTDLNKSFLPIVEEKNIESPDVIIADPPRSGMNPKTVNDILTLKPKKIVYVSCNPSTQARDIKLLTDGGYKLLKARPVDMFPHTYHIENVALLELK